MCAVRCHRLQPGQSRRILRPVLSAVLSRQISTRSCHRPSRTERPEADAHPVEQRMASNRFIVKPPSGDACGLYRVQSCDQPPSTGSSAPVVKVASNARKRTAFAISSDVPKRFIGFMLDHVPHDLGTHVFRGERLCRGSACRWDRASPR